MRVLQGLMDEVYSFFFYTPIDPLIVGLKLIVLICIAIISYFLAQKLIVFISLRIRKGKDRYRFETHIVRNSFKANAGYKMPVLKLIDGILEKNGRPLGLNAARYIAVKVSLGIVAAVLPLLLEIKTAMVMIFGLVGFLLLDALLVIDAIDNNKRIEKDMPNVINNLYMQMEANIPFKQCLETLHMSAIHSRLLRNCLKELQLRFLLKDHDIVAVCDDLENRLNDVSFSVLLMAFRQYKDSGKMKDILKRQNELHMKKEEELIERESRGVIKLAAASTVLIAVNCMLMLVYPMFVTMNEKMEILLK